MVQGRLMHGRLPTRIERLHQIHFDLKRAAAQRRDVLVDILPLADIVAGHGKSEHVHPEPFQARLVRPADGDVLDAEYLERLHVLGPFERNRSSSPTRTIGRDSHCPMLTV